MSGSKNQPVISMHCVHFCLYPSMINSQAISIKILTYKKKLYFSFSENTNKRKAGTLKNRRGEMNYCIFKFSILKCSSSAFISLGGQIPVVPMVLLITILSYKPMAFNLCHKRSWQKLMKYLTHFLYFLQLTS